MQKNLSMVTGKPFRTLLVFALPMVAGNFLQQLYSIVDSVIVGKVCGQNALNAVGSTSTVVYVFVAIALGLSTGCMIVFSQLLGAGHIGRMKTAYYTAIITLGALSIICMALGLLFTDGILHLTNVPDNFYSDAKTYYQIYTLGFPAMFIYNIANSGFNAMGKSKITLALLGASSLLNVGLDWWFVAGLGWGVMGAAVATDISQYIVAVIALILLLRDLRVNYKTEEKGAVFEFGLLGNMLKVAIPTMLAQVVVSVGYSVLQSLVNTFDNDIISGYVAGYRIDSICGVPMIQFGNAMATFAGQNVGAQKYERVPKGIIASGFMCAGIWVIFFAIVKICGHGLIGLFMDANASEAAYTAGVQYIQVMSSTYIILGLMYVFAATLRGAGDSNVSVIAVLCNFASRCAFAYIMVAALGHAAGSELAIWWCNPIGWMVGLTICVIRYATGKWKTKRIADKV